MGKSFMAPGGSGRRISHDPRPAGASAGAAACSVAVSFAS